MRLELTGKGIDITAGIRQLHVQQHTLQGQLRLLNHDEIRLTQLQQAVEVAERAKEVAVAQKEQERATATAQPGTLVTFRSETTHEVTPVTHGVRYTIATWFRAP